MFWYAYTVFLVGFLRVFEPLNTIPKTIKTPLNISSKTSQNPIKIVPGLLPKRHSKNNRKKNNRIDKNAKFAPQLGPWGGVATSVFGSFSSPGDPWNQNGPKTSPKSLRDPPRASLFHDFRSILDAVFGSCCCFVGFLWALWNKEQRTKNKEQRTKNEVGTVAEMARRAPG